MMALFMHSIVMDTNTEDAMHAGVCPQEWLTVCQKVYQATRHWIADHASQRANNVHSICRARVVTQVTRPAHVGPCAVTT
jgi:hypothetical protein